MLEGGLDALQRRLGYRFKDQALLQRSLTHKSRAFESTPRPADDRADDNEQLEFLGDSILGFLISELLVARHPSFPEGRLSKLKAYLVSANHLYVAAQKVDLGSCLLLGKGEELSGGRHKRALLANAVEAIIAAMYLDGGIEPVRKFVLQAVVDEFDQGRGEDASLVVDHKSALQEAAQVRGLPMPRYFTIKETGPEHQKTFTVEARVGTLHSDCAEGTSKKAAGQKAAQSLLERLEALPKPQGLGAAG
jgi:ribonuclease-3